MAGSRAAGSLGWASSGVTVTCIQSASGRALSRPSSWASLSARYRPTIVVSPCATPDLQTRTRCPSLASLAVAAASACSRSLISDFGVLAGMSSAKATRKSMSSSFGSCVLSHRRFDDGNVLLCRSPADSDAGDHLALAGERHAAAHRGVSPAGDGEEGIKGCAWLHEGDEVSGAHADEGGRVGLSLGELEGERGRSGHAVGENDVAVDVDDGDRDGYVLFERLGLDALSDVLRDAEQVHGRVLPSREWDR